MNYILAIDYDGTLFTGSYPHKGDPIWEVINKVKKFKKAGAEIVLWTCREAGTLQEAIDRCRKVGLEFDAVNENAPSHAPYVAKMLKKNGHIFANRKIYANMYVDDKSHPSIEYFLNMDVKDTINSRKKK